MSTAANETETQSETPKIEEAGATIEIPPDPPKDDPKPSRAERRDSKAAGWAEEARQAREEARQAREALQRQEVALAELKGRVTAGEAGRPDPNEAALADVAKRMETVVARMGQGDQDAVKEWHTLRREEHRLVARIEAAAVSKETEERIRKEIPQQTDPRQAALIAEFPALQDDAEFRAVASGHVARLVRNERRNMDDPRVRFATLREGAALAARDLGMGGDERKEPSTRDRERISGTGSGDSGAGGGSTKVHMTAAQMKMAEQLYRDKSKEEAHALWWKNVGSKIANK